MNRRQRRAAAKLAGAEHANAVFAPAARVVADLFEAGVTRQQAGQLAEAETCYRQVLAIKPDHADALHLLGLIAHQVGRPDAAVELIRQAIQRNGKSAAYFANLGTVLRAQGKLEKAVAACRQAIHLSPDFAEAHYNLGNALRAQGKLDEAVAAYHRTIDIKPDIAEAHSNLGNALRDQGKLGGAVAAYRQAIRIRPDFAEAHYNLGNALYAQGQLDEAVAAYRDALGINPDFAEAYSNLGNALVSQGKHDEAVAEFRQAIRLSPDFAEAHYNLGNALYAQGKLDEAVAAYHQTIDIKPDIAEAHSNLGNALRDQGKLGGAVAAYRQAIRIRPDFAEAHSNLGVALTGQGKHGEAVAAYRRALTLRPNYCEAGSNLLLCMNYDDEVSVSHLFDAHREWNERHGRIVLRPILYANDRTAGRRLKIGYVSPDFRNHGAHFLEPLLRSHNRKEVEVFCYAEVNRADPATERFIGLADQWLVTVGMPNEALAERIRRDGIDILVDLAGHTANNRLLVFAGKPAPVQVTWLGYPNSTGLEAIDYRFVDAVTDPPREADVWASETLVRLEGGFLCYGVLYGSPEPAAPPCSATGSITFGSFNNVAKLSESTLDVWASLLARLPDARILLKDKSFSDSATAIAFLDRLRKRGVASERIELAAWLPEGTAHLALYNWVDIALDPFPYNGTTTTCDALWMGVPVVALRGDRHAGRVAASLLTQLELMDLIGDSVDEYVEIAVALASDPARLNDLRRSLRPRMAASRLCDGPAFARQVEGAYRAMWKRWCEAPTHTPRKEGVASGE